MPSKNGTIYTIGHSNHSMKTFINLLRQYDIEAVVDVRSHPHSKYVPHFNSKALRVALELNGFKHLFLGKDLGGHPDDLNYYDKDGYVLYARIATSKKFIEGVSRLVYGIKKYRVVIMCSEEDPCCCHRRLLIGRVLYSDGLNVNHIRGDGNKQTEEDLLLSEQQTISQLSFFDKQEDYLWKSTQSVIQKKLRKNSLDY